MMTLRQFSAEPSTIPTIASWYLADLSKAQGKQELFTHQSPQKLRILREHALVESAVSSNRIEGVNVDQSRIRTIVFGKTLLKDRDEKDLSGKYRLTNIFGEKDGDPVEVYHVWNDEYLKNIRIDEKYLKGIILRSRGKLKGNYYISNYEMHKGRTEVKHEKELL